MDNQAQVVMYYDIPLAELITFFFDRLKTVTSGYATLQWELKEFRPVDADKLVILLNLEPVEEFSEFVVTERAYPRGRELVDKLKELIPRQQFEVKIQAHYKGKIIASSRIAPFRKDVTAKLYGGDRTRKDKLLNKQKEGKKKMKNIGAVEVPKDVFIKLFKSS
jgi:GTP-binding protein LepA